VSHRPSDAVHGVVHDAVHGAVSLARLALDADEAERLVAECRRVVSAWQGLPPLTDDEESRTATVEADRESLRDVLRDDEPAAGLSTAEALAGAPDAVDGAFRVPRVADVS